MAKIKNKAIKKLTKEHEYYAKKVDEIEKERTLYRDFGHKALLMKLKKTKLYIKDQIDRLLKNEA
jgi:uncharacterized protein YdcH (DUF465 family)